MKFLGVLGSSGVKFLESLDPFEGNSWSLRTQWLEILGVLGASSGKFLES